MSKRKSVSAVRGSQSSAAKLREEVREVIQTPPASVTPIRPGIVAGIVKWTAEQLDTKVQGCLGLYEGAKQSVAEIAEAWATGAVTTAMLAHAHLKYGKQDNGVKFFQALKTAIYRYHTASNGGTSPAKYKTVKVNPKGVLIETEAKARKAKAAVTMDTKTESIKKWIASKGFALPEIKAFHSKMNAMFTGLVASLEAANKSA